MSDDTRAYETGDKIQLKGQEVEIVKCQECEALMVNLDVDQLQPGDLTTLKKSKVRISNPETEKPVCISCEYQTFGRRLSDWFDNVGTFAAGAAIGSMSSNDDDDDSSFFGGRGGFGGGFGGFGGFGGGGFGGGGVSRGF